MPRTPLLPLVSIVLSIGTVYSSVVTQGKRRGEIEKISAPVQATARQEPRCRFGPTAELVLIRTSRLASRLSPLASLALLSHLLGRRPYWDTLPTKNTMDTGGKRGDSVLQEDFNCRLAGTCTYMHRPRTQIRRGYVAERLQPPANWCHREGLPGLIST